MRPVLGLLLGCAILAVPVWVSQVHSPSYDAPPARPRETPQQRREKYLAAHPDTRGEIAAAIRAGRLARDMHWYQAEAELGRLEKRAEGGGAGGSWEMWTHREAGRTTILHFRSHFLEDWTIRSD